MGPQLTLDETILLAQIAEQTLHANTIDDITRLIEQELQRVLPHQLMIGGVGYIRGREVLPLALVSENFPNSYMREVLSEEGYVRSPFISWWIRERKPMLVNLNEAPAYVDPISRQRLQRYGVLNFVAYGQADFPGVTGTYFWFANVAERAGPKHGRILEFIVPHLHAAFTRLAIENKRAGRRGPVPRLTPKELEILQLIYEGNSNKDISEALAISLMTVKNHTKNIYTKMQVKSRSEAIVKGIELQLVCLDRWLASACRQRPAGGPPAAETAIEK